MSVSELVSAPKQHPQQQLPERDMHGTTTLAWQQRDRMRLEYLNNKIWKDDTVCVNMLRLNRAKFFRFCNLFRDRGLLEDTIHCCVEQQVAMFLNTVGHNLRNRVVGTNFDRSGETVSRYFNRVLRAVGELRGELITPPSLETPTKIQGNHRWDPYFKDCIGAIDGTHVRASVPKDMELAFRGRKSYASQNVMAAVDFDLRFTYVLAGWEGTAHDALVLRDALERENGLRVPQGKFYLVDAGYGAKPGFLPPFRGVRYHLNEWGNNPVQNEKELFNLRHSSLRITVERAFGCLKRRFKILDDATPFFPFPTQVDIVVACCIIHNWVIQDGIDEFFIEDNNFSSYNHATTYSGQAHEHTEMGLGRGTGVAAWTAPMSNFMLKNLANVVASGVKTGKGFKKVYFNACARAVNEKFNTTLNGEQIKNHLKTWQRKWAKITRLKSLSASGFDEENYIITLDEEHYNGHVHDHKADAEYLNKPLENYAEMETIFGKDMATGKFAKDSSAPLGTEDGDTEDGAANGTEEDPSSAFEEGATSNARPNKRAKIVESAEEGLIGAFNRVGDKLAMAITQVAKSNNELPEDLFDKVNSLSVSGFNDLQISTYYAHLVANPLIGKAFYGLPFQHQLHWMAMFVSERFPGQ
ncbi:uncharacterized protein LOC101777193 [Setaria italica]|uniref:uncharacterized protein LOC101777193 n=1 Tax=Setaria italica TaxID=4555 RepID=UPI000BE4D0DD|nr:uncharacterized protein LOC101777193 [Setaria italica]